MKRKVTLSLTAREMLAAWAAENGIVLHGGEVHNNPITGNSWFEVDLDDDVIAALKEIDPDPLKALLIAIGAGT